MINFILSKLAVADIYIVICLIAFLFISGLSKIGKPGDGYRGLYNEKKNTENPDSLNHNQKRIKNNWFKNK
ncbi:MAG: hypothetical protein AAB432_02165 [Patescibacteria group bacterium]